MDIRDELITGSFSIGVDGRKEPISWKEYALKLEEKIEKSKEKPKSLLNCETCDDYYGIDIYHRCFKCHNKIF